MIASAAPTPSCIPTSINEEAWRQANGVARHAEHHDQPNFLAPLEVFWETCLSKWKGESLCCSHVFNIAWRGSPLRGAIDIPEGHPGCNLLYNVPQVWVPFGAHKTLPQLSPKSCVRIYLQWNEGCWVELVVVVTTWQLTFRLALTSPFPLRMSQPNDMSLTFVRMVQITQIHRVGKMHNI